MARGRHPSWREGTNSFGAHDGRKRRRRPSRGLIIGVGAAGALAVVLALLGAIVAQSPSSEGQESPAPAQEEPSRPIGTATATVTPEATPRPEYTADEPEPSAEDKDRQVIAGVAATPISSVVEGPQTVASSWSAPPEPPDPLPAPVARSEARSLAAQAEDEHGVVLHLDGWDWGAGEASQTANVQAVVTAMERLPEPVVSATVSHPHGPLSFVSNDVGRTLDGWQPYGSHPMSYYTNSDQGPGGYRGANQAVLNVGSASMSVGHEVLHSYQFRNVGPDQYVLALLQPEMVSFMEATGWRQVGTDQQVREAVNQPWSALDELFVQEGRPLTYTTAGGSTVSLSPPNPVEAFAVAGSMYYTRPSWIPLPDWPEYWAWFDAHLGKPTSAV